MTDKAALLPMPIDWRRALVIVAHPDDIILGGGPAGCEFASIFTALGLQVSLIDRAPRLLPFLDHEISDLLASRSGRWASSCS